MASSRLKLTFPADRVRDPIIGTLTRRFDVMPNIRRARIGEEAGECVLELDGTEESLEQAKAYLEELGVIVEPVEGDYLQS
jgi:L-aspartate semialdehyde sulfurtransferase ferredoxin